MVHSQHALGGRFNPDRHQPSRRLRAHPLRRRTPSAPSGPDTARHYVFGGIEESPRYPLQSSFFCASAVTMNKTTALPWKWALSSQRQALYAQRVGSGDQGVPSANGQLPLAGCPRTPYTPGDLAIECTHHNASLAGRASRANRHRAEVPLRTLRQCGPCVDPTTTVAAPVRFQPLQLCASCAHCRANATHPHHTLAEGISPQSLRRAQSSPDRGRPGQSPGTYTDVSLSSQHTTPPPRHHCLPTPQTGTGSAPILLFTDCAQSGRQPIPKGCLRDQGDPTPASHCVVHQAAQHNHRIFHPPQAASKMNAHPAVLCPHRSQASTTRLKLTLLSSA